MSGIGLLLLGFVFLIVSLLCYSSDLFRREICGLQREAGGSVVWKCLAKLMATIRAL
jgi:hypothetical protein